MNRTLRLGQLGPAIRLMVLLTVLLGLAYPLATTGLAQLVFPGRANGSLVHRDDRLVGSSLIGQSFAGDPAYFQGRPSAGGYDPLTTGASNLALDNPDLIKLVGKRRAQVSRSDGIPVAAVPADALLASGSGLDPQISPAYAAVQVARVSRTRHLSPVLVRHLVAEHTTGRTLGFLGEPRVNVLELNLALDRATSTGRMGP